MIDIAATKNFIIQNFLFGDASKLTDDATSFLDSGIIDSTGMLELISFLEENYAIKINDDEILPENLDSLHNIAGFLSRKTNA